MSDNFYSSLLTEARALLDGETDAIANAANLSALLYLRLPDVNWVGFYFMRDGGLLVGPFNGKPACTRIAVGQGVCGTAMAEQRTLRVADVHAFAGHIACDPDSRSEIVVPLGELGVLDIDSPRPDRFSATDQAGLEQIAALYLESIS